MAQTDDALVRAVQNGTIEAFDRLMLRYQKLICKVAMNYVKDKQSALDVTQNVFLKAYRHMHSVQAEGMFKPWLLRITYNESVNWLRKRSRQESREEPVELERQLPVAAEQEARLLDGEARKRLLAGLDRLNPKYRLALALRYAEGMRIREIAEAMGCSEGVVKSMLFRGVKRIKQHVSGGP